MTKTITLRSLLLVSFALLVLTPVNRSLAQESRSLWTHNGSTLLLTTKGDIREFRYEVPRNGMLDAGAKPGDLVFHGTAHDGKYSGTAYIFNRRCGALPYGVRGPISHDYKQVTLHGLAPQVNARCVTQGRIRDTLTFRLVDAKSTNAASSPQLPVDFVGVWIQAESKDNGCKSAEWEQRGTNNADYEHYTRLEKITANSTEGWESRCTISKIVTKSMNLANQAVSDLSLDCVQEGTSSKTRETWTTQEIDGRRVLNVLVTKIFEVRDENNKLMRSTGPNNIPITYLKCAP